MKIKNSNLNRHIHFEKWVISCLILCLAYVSIMRGDYVQADTSSSVVVTPDYIQETATVTAGTGSSIKFYMSTDNQKTWDLIDSSGVVDISSIMATKEVTVWFKGNKDTNPAKLTIPAESSALKVIYKVTNGVGTIEYTSSTPVEYRKGANGPWKLANSGMSTAIYELRGTKLSFRTVATTLARAGKVVTVKISKRPAAPSVKVDGGKLNITGLKSGETQYRVGDSATWVTFNPSSSTTKTLDLSVLLAPTAAANTALPAAIIEFRSMGNDKKVYSSVKVVNIALQLAVPDTITLIGTTIKTTDTDTKRSYEYTVVSNGSTLNLNTAKWTSFTSRNTVIAKNAKIGDTVFVRLKTTTNTTTKNTILASTYKSFPVASVTIK